MYLKMKNGIRVLCKKQSYKGYANNLGNYYCLIKFSPLFKMQYLYKCIFYNYIFLICV